MHDTFLKFESIFLSLPGTANQASEVELADHFEDDGSLKDHMSNLAVAVAEINATPPPKLIELEGNRGSDDYKINSSVLVGTSQKCLRENLIDPVMVRGRHITDVDHIEDAVRVMHTWARLHGIKRR
ncbi:MAG: hypothetical protein GF416_05710 [Candidatus Altiarchaeales archaeon]|nr:hypothetical protein [Candidatus Altiarchaeales archaeon]